MRLKTIIGWTLFGGALLGASRASADEAIVSATSDIQLYAIPNPWGTQELRARRYTQTLGLRVADLLDRGPTGPQVGLATRLRMDPDFGVSRAERAASRSDYFVPGLEEAPVDLMYGYVEGRSLLGGWLTARAGRQYVMDALGWWSFDGALARVTTPTPIALELYGGFEQRAGLAVLSTSRFAADGVYRGARRDLELNQWPSYLTEERPAPAYGFSAIGEQGGWLRAVVGYRRVTNRDRVIVSPFPERPGEYEVYGEDRVSSERIGGTLTLSHGHLGGLDGTLVYDLLQQRPTEHAARLTWRAQRDVTLTASHDYYFPTFDGDSIFNWFAHRGVFTETLATEVAVGRRVEVGASVGARAFATEGDANRDASATELSRDAHLTTDALGTLGGRCRFARGTADLALDGEAGPDGHHLGADATVRRYFAGGLYDTLVNVSLHDFTDEVWPERGTTTLGYVLGGGVNPGESSRLGVEWEHTMSTLVGQRFRMFATLEVATWL